MAHIHSISDCHLIDTPELYREVYSYLLNCQYEMQKYADEDDNHDFNFIVLSEEDLPMLNDLGAPEETVQISTKSDGRG